MITQKNGQFEVFSENICDFLLIQCLFLLKGNRIFEMYPYSVPKVLMKILKEIYDEYEKRKY